MSVLSMGLGTVGKYVHIGKPAGIGVFDPIGDQAGRIHDVVATFWAGGTGSVIGFAVEVGSRKKVFPPLTRVISIEAGSVIMTGLLSIRSFTQRPVETPAFAELFDRTVMLNDGLGEVKIPDVVMERRRPKNRAISKLHVQRQCIAAFGLTRLGETLNVRVSEVSGLLRVDTNQAATSLIAQTRDVRPVDLANYFHDLPTERQTAIAQQPSNTRFADVLEELGDDDRVAIVSSLEVNRAADVLDAMQPDDAADPVSELPEAQAQALLSLMEPEKAKDVRRLLSHAESTTGSLMMTDPVILDPDAMVAQMLASVRRGDLPVSLAVVAFVTHLPEEIPTGPYLGMVRIQCTLHEPPQALFGTIFDSDTEVVFPQVHITMVTRLLTTYSLTVLLVVDGDSYLFDVMSVGDFLGEFLLEDRRNHNDEMTDHIMARSIDGRSS